MVSLDFGQGLPRLVSHLIKVDDVTLADLEVSADVRKQHLAEALQYRGLDRSGL
ncbi:MAG: hypothetical protein WCU88_01290 [Elusimicrobiota bacterium]|jgi:predicted ATPase with chaperone activity